MPCCAAHAVLCMLCCASVCPAAPRHQPCWVAAWTVPIFERPLALNAVTWACKFSSCGSHAAGTCVWKQTPHAWCTKCSPPTMDRCWTNSRWPSRQAGASSPAPLRLVTRTPATAAALAVQACWAAHGRGCMAGWVPMGHQWRPLLKEPAVLLLPLLPASWASAASFVLLSLPCFVVSL